MRKIFTLVAVATVVTLPASLEAQASAADDISVLAEVLAGITVNGDRSLDFGTVVAGTGSYSVDPGDANAGRFAVTGQQGQDVSIDLDVPNQLVNGGALLNTDFSGNVAGWSASSDGSGMNVFQPSAQPTVQVPGSGELWVFIGGGIDLPQGQEPGSYSGTVTATVSYVGL